MINGVLVERTVGEVLPTLQTNADGLKEVMESLVKQYKTKQEEMEKWKVCLPPVECSTSRSIVANSITEEEQRPSGSTVRPLHRYHLLVWTVSISSAGLDLTGATTAKICAECYATVPTSVVSSE